MVLATVVVNLLSKLHPWVVIVKQAATILARSLLANKTIEITA